MLSERFSEQMKKSDNNTKISDICLSFILAFMGTVGTVGIVAPGTISISGSLGREGAVIYDRISRITYTNSFFAFLFFGMGAYILYKLMAGFRSASARDRVFAYVFSFALSFALHMGASLESTDNVNFKDLFFYAGAICFGLFMAPVINALWSVFRAKSAQKKTDETRPRLVKIWAMIFILWFPTFMAFFPGAFVYDATDEYAQAFTNIYNAHHPLLHVLLLGKIIRAAEVLGLGTNTGIAVYTLLQMIVCSLAVGYFILKLFDMGIGRKGVVGFVFFFGLFPLFPMYAVCSAKDELFTMAFLMLIILMYEWIFESKEKPLLLTLMSVLMMLLRKNGVYAYIVSAIIILLMISVRERRENAGETKENAGKGNKIFKYRIVILMALSIILYLGTDHCLKLATHASDGEHQEMLTVGIQQMARVYKYAPETFSEEEKQTLYEVLPENYLITYSARCSDILKSGFDNGAYERDPGKYRKLWLKIGMRKPLVYLNAWLVNSYGFWYPDMIINVYGGQQMYTYRYENSSYFGFETEPPGKRVSLFPLYERFYRNISLELFQQTVPVISMLFAPGFMMWIFAWAFVGFIREKDRKAMIVYLPVLILWLTVLLGPTVLVRYVLILWFAVPMMLVHILKGNTPSVTEE